MAKAILIVGRTKSGKTTDAKKLLKKFIKNEKDKERVIIYDINKEYCEFYDEPLADFETFCEQILPLKNKFFLFEEATIFFDARSSNKILTNKLVRKRHENNIIVLNFHSFSQVPRYIVNLIDYVIIHKTNDTEEIVKKKFEKQSFLDAFNSVMEDESPYAHYVYDVYAN